MPHGAVVIADGVNENRTPTQTQFGLSFSQLVRYQFDNQGTVLVQKLGGWSRFYSIPISAPVRALWPWEDTNGVAHLGYGTQTLNGKTYAELGVITEGMQEVITPTSTTDNVTPAATTISGQSTVVITDATTTNISSFDSVFIQTHISVGGLILFGQYATTAVSSTTYDITATDVLGNPQPATGSTSSTSVASFATTSGTSAITVTLNGHGYSVGSTYPVLVSTTVGGVTLFGNYIVQQVLTANTFVILAATRATSSTSGSINGGNARYVYSFGVSALPLGSGFGGGGFGLGPFGIGASTASPIPGTPINANNWVLDNLGEILLACPINGSLYQPIYQWDPLSGQPIATVIPNAPTLNDGFFVAMPQRQIVTWGSTFTGIQDPLLIRYCDVNNLNSWIGLPTNQAGSFRLTKGSRIVAGIQGPQQGLIWTDIDLWAMQYIGSGGSQTPLVYGFNEIGTGCGLISRKAVASANGVIYWMGPSQFFTLSGDGVQPLQCPVWDVMFQDLDQTNLDLIRVAVNSRFNEVAWHYPTLASGGEVAAFVKYNYAIGFWDYGPLARSAWTDQSVLGPPIGADPNTLFIYQHETSPDADGQAMLASCQTGYFALNEGDELLFVDQVWPDAKWGTYGGTPNATLNVTLYGLDYPGDIPTLYGPYAVTQQTQYFTPRLRHRLFSISFGSSDVGSFWRIGHFRFRFQPDGKF